MKTIIAGSRDLTDPKQVEDAIRLSGFYITEVLCGECRGADRFGSDWAEYNGLPVHHFPADWEKYGRAAGPIRNGNMADQAEALVAVWDGQSRGTKNMIETAERHGLQVFVHRI